MSSWECSQPAPRGCAGAGADTGALLRPLPTPAALQRGGHVLEASKQCGVHRAQAVCPFSWGAGKAVAGAAAAGRDHAGPGWVAEQVWPDCWDHCSQITPHYFCSSLCLQSTDSSNTRKNKYCIHYLVLNWREAGYLSGTWKQHMEDHSPGGLDWVLCVLTKVEEWTVCGSDQVSVATTAAMMDFLLLCSLFAAPFHLRRKSSLLKV